MQKYWVYKDSNKMRPLIYGDVNKFFMKCVLIIWATCLVAGG
jgi:hypothetical protein